MKQKKIILDCDPGMDDSMAIVMACKAPELDLLAVTTVNGNYPAGITCVNALKTLELLGRTDIPVAKGMESPMVRPSPRDPFTHGEDGQAENFLPEPAARPCEKHAVDLLIDLVKAAPGEITILCTGPMSNLAIAMQKAPEIKGMIREIIAITGAFGLNACAWANATGDTPMSEWNVYVDPEAADLVYRSGVKLTALGLDVATHFDVNLTEADIAALEKSPNKEAGFLRQAIRHRLHGGGLRHRPHPGGDFRGPRGRRDGGFSDPGHDSPGRPAPFRLGAAPPDPHRPSRRSPALSPAFDETGFGVISERSFRLCMMKR